MIVFLLLGSSLETLPWQGTTKEVREDIGQGFKVIATCLLNSQMGVDGHITSRASKILVLPVGNMEMSLLAVELLGETKIDNIELIASFTDAHKGVVRLDVAMNEILRMYVFDSRYLRHDGIRKETPKTDWTHQLICKEQDGLETELPVAEVEEVLE